MGNFRNLVIGIVSWTSFLGALPTTPTVVSGTVTFDTSMSNTLIVNSTSDLSIVNWASFTVLGYETVIFNLPSSTSAILNRVTGAVATQINGFIYASPSRQETELSTSSTIMASLKVLWQPLQPAAF